MISDGGRAQGQPEKGDDELDSTPVTPIEEEPQVGEASDKWEKRERRKGGHWSPRMSSQSDYEGPGGKKVHSKRKGI